MSNLRADLLLKKPLLLYQQEGLRLVISNPLFTVAAASGPAAQWCRAE
jgi:hypothetical protein